MGFFNQKEDPVALLQERMLDEGYKKISAADLKKKQAKVAAEQKKAASK